MGISITYFFGLRMGIGMGMVLINNQLLISGQSHENGGYLFRAFRTGTKSKILTFVNFFCVFSTSFVPWYKKPKSLKIVFFEHMRMLVLFYLYQRC